MASWFNERKAAQVAAFFCCSEGGNIDVLKLIKLIYLSDRKSMELSGFPITNDQFVSMPHGPVNSMTLNYVDGNAESKEWSAFVRDRANYKVGSANKQLSDDDLDELSEFDLEILQHVWKQFGHMSKWEIRDWTHDNCPEWEDPHGSANPIPVERILKYIGIPDAEHQAQEIKAHKKADRVFAQLKA